MSKFKLVARVFLLLVVVLFLLSCGGGEKKQQTATQPKRKAAPVNIQIVADPSIYDPLNRLIEKFKATKPVLPDGSKISLEVLWKDGYDAAQELSSGRVKVDGWIAPSAGLVQFANTRVRNLGARHTDCVSLFKTPMVLATRESVALELGADRKNWGEFFEYYLGLTGEEGDTGELAEQIKFGHVTPRGSSVGLASLIQYATLVFGSGEGLADGSLVDDVTIAQLRNSEKLAFAYGVDEAQLLSKAALATPIYKRIAITSERALIRFNKGRSAGEKLRAVYPTDGVYWRDFMLCSSDVEWVTASRKSAVRAFADFILSRDSQAILTKNGFRPVLADLAVGSPFDAKHGVLSVIDAPELPAPAPEVFEFLVNHWDDIRRPQVIVLIADESGSMLGESIDAEKRELVGAVNILVPKDEVGLVAFGAKARVIQKPVRDRKVLTDKILALEASGGGAAYDGIKKAIDIVVEPEHKEKRKTIVVVVDGEDLNSELSITLLVQRLRNAVDHHDLSVFIVRIIGEEPADLADLRSIADSSGGELLSGKLENLSDLFKKVLSGL